MLWYWKYNNYNKKWTNQVLVAILSLNSIIKVKLLIEIKKSFLFSLTKNTKHKCTKSENEIDGSDDSFLVFGYDLEIN